MAVTPGSHFLTADGITFHYHVSGTGPLIVVQSVGWGMPGHYLSNGMEKLTETHTVIYFDPRGNGLSSCPADDNTMCSKVMQDDLEYLRQELKLEAFPVLLGHSNGAGIALGYAEKYPTRVSKLILVSSQVHNGPAGSNEEHQNWIAKRMSDPRYASATPILQNLDKNLPRTPEQFKELFEILLPWYLSEAKFDLTPRVAEQMDRGTTPPSTYAFRLWQQLDLKKENAIPHLSDAKKVQAKTLLLWGKDDATCSVVNGYALEKAIPSAELVPFDECGHFPWVEAPEGFWAALESSLRP